MERSTYDTWYCQPCQWHFDYDDDRIKDGSHSVVMSSGSGYSTSQKDAIPHDDTQQAPAKKKGEIDWLAINRMFR
jgi:hypothetical protein